MLALIKMLGGAAAYPNPHAAPHADQISTSAAGNVGRQRPLHDSEGSDLHMPVCDHCLLALHRAGPPLQHT